MPASLLWNTISPIDGPRVKNKKKLTIPSRKQKEREYLVALCNVR